MLKNYLKIAIRNILRSKVHALINITGLVIGISACIVILLYIQHEFSYDKFHKKGDRIYRLIVDINNNGKNAKTPAAFGKEIVNRFSQVKLARIYIFESPVIEYGNKDIRATNFIFADTSFFNVFTFPLLQGDSNTVLSEPFSVVISLSEAKRLFGNSSPIGKIVKYNDKYLFKVTGVMKDVPENSSIRCNFVADLNSLSKIENPPGLLNDYGKYSFHTFILVPNIHMVGMIKSWFPKFVKQHYSQIGLTVKLSLQPLRDVHLSYGIRGNLPFNGNFLAIILFAGMALLILIVACINYITLMTARSSRRIKEVGMRKVLGAQRNQLVKQFITESIIITLIAVVGSLCLVEIILPKFNSLFFYGLNISLDYFHNHFLIISTIVLWLLVGVIAGSYPAFIISFPKPAVVFRGDFKLSLRGILFRRTLIIFQFFISAVILSCTLIIMHQYSFINSRDLGFNHRNLIELPLNDEIRNHFNAFKQNLIEKQPGINITYSNNMPGFGGESKLFFPENSNQNEGKEIETLTVGENFINTLGLNLISGNDFNRTEYSGAMYNLILSESAVKDLGNTSANIIGKQFKIIYGSSNYTIGKVTGVIKDSYIVSVQKKIPSVVLIQAKSDQEQQSNFMLIRIISPKTKSVLNHLKNIWSYFSHKHPFEYFSFDSQYKIFQSRERTLAGILGGSSLLAVFIACLGLFGLSSYLTERRTKEIGIRRAFGASKFDIFKLIVREFLIIVCMANLIAFPLAYFIMNNWLKNYPERITIGNGEFLISLFVTVVLTLLTVSYRTLKASATNPVESLRYE